MACGKDDAFLLDRPHAGCRATVSCPGTLAHLDKHQGTVARLHDEVDFATPTPGRPIIALKQAQARSLQMLQGPVFGRRPRLTGAAATQVRQFLEERH